VLWLQTIDTGLFRFINQALSNSVCDALMPFISGNSYSLPLFQLAAAALILTLLWKGGARGAVFVVMVLVAVAVSDGLVCNPLKHLVARQRPFMSLADVNLLTGAGGSGSMPSSHAANMFAVAFTAFIYYRRSVFFMLPFALLVGLSRIYIGVHYPGDVLVGFAVGAGSAAGSMFLVNALWQWIGKRWFPLWWAAIPNLLHPVPDTGPPEDEELPDAESDIPLTTVGSAKRTSSFRQTLRPGSHTARSATFAPPVPPRVKGRPEPGFKPPHLTMDQQWLRLGYLMLAVLLVARLAYIASGTIQLCEDEAYQWLWSKHLALSYYSKPPLIAYAQWFGTTLWGQNAFGVRFLSPVISSVLGLLLLRFLARVVNARAGFFLLLVLTATPLLSVGALLMTVDPLSVLFWTAATVAGWKAIQDNSSSRDWIWVGLWMGLGFLSKYTALVQLICWVVFFALWQPARKQLKRPGPYLALLVNLLCTLPVLYWNYHRGWITVQHLADNAGGSSAWQHPIKFPVEFLGSELGLLNPVFFVLTVWACIRFWRTGRHDPRLIFLFSMGAPLFLLYLLQSFRGRVLPNWIVPAVIPLFCLAAIYWEARIRLGSTQVRKWLAVGLVLGLPLVLLAHNTDLWRHTLTIRSAIAAVVPDRYSNLREVLTSEYLPVNADPLHRVRVWDQVAQVAGMARKDLLAQGKPVFIIGEHYGLTGLISFYLPEAREHVTDDPLVYYRTTQTPQNQFFFWPGYTQRKGDNAICVLELDRDDPEPMPPPFHLTAEFESVTSLGVSNVLYHGKLCRPIQVFVCRGLK
jgi:membrane-associated phospholipid phosphatase